MSRAAFVVLLLFTSFATAQPPAAEPIIQFPSINTPTPPVNPTSPVKLDGSRLYVVSADVPLLAWSFPEGLLKITSEVGPIRIRAQYVDGNGLETREYKAKHVLIIEATGTGRVSLLVLPAGATTKTAGVVKVLDVAMAPRPPPDVDPKPDPTEPTDALFAPLKAAWLAEKDAQAQRDLVSLYRVSSGDTLAKAATAGDLLAKMHGAADVLLAGKLLKVRRVLADETNRAIPLTASTVLTPALRTQLAAQFTRYATLLEALP